MCKPASMIVTRDRVSWSKMTDNHTSIIEEFSLVEMVANKCCFVRVEITPPCSRFDAPLADWCYRVDQDILPDWYDKDPDKYEQRVRDTLKDWHKQKVVTEDHRDIDCGTLYVCDHAAVDIFGNAVADIFDHAVAKISGHATAEISGDATAEISGHATVDIFGNAAAKIGGNAVANIYDHATAEIFDHAAVDIFGNAVADIFGNAAAKIGGNAVANIFGNAVADIYDNANVQAEENATIIQYGGTVTLKGKQAVCVDRRKDIVVCRKEK